jgi:hypothetical protein
MTMGQAQGAAPDCFPEFIVVAGAVLFLRKKPSENPPDCELPGNVRRALGCFRSESGKMIRSMMEEECSAVIDE